MSCFFTARSGGINHSGISTRSFFDSTSDAVHSSLIGTSVNFVLGYIILVFIFLCHMYTMVREEVTDSILDPAQWTGAPLPASPTSVGSPLCVRLNKLLSNVSV